MRQFFLLFLAITATVSCKKRNDQQLERPLNISFKSEVRSLDPRYGVDYPSVYAVKMLFEGLMRIGLDGHVKPALAESFEISSDQKIYTFHLRPSFWSNGDPVTAYDFEYSWKSVCDPKTKTIGVHNFYPIKNVRAIVTGQLPPKSIGIKALDAKTIRIELEHPTPYFLEVLATCSFMPINARVDRENPHWANEDGEAFVCNGPFTLQRNQLDHEIQVKKNPAYWDVKSVRLPGINIAIIKEPLTQLHLFEKGELDWAGKPISKMPLEAMDEFKKQGKVSFTPNLGLYWIFINTQSFPFYNKKMRQAFSYALNRQAITDYILREEETPAMSLLPCMLSQQETPYFADNQREKARALFEEALKELDLTREELPEITYSVSNEPVHMKVAETLQEQWQQVFGVQVRIDHQDWKAHYGSLQNGDYQIGGMAWVSWLRDPIYILQTFRYRADGVNMSRWEDAHYQSLLTASEEEIDPNRRKEYFHQAESLLMDEMPVIPIYFTTITYMKNDHLKDVYISELNEVDFRWAYFDTEKK